MNLKEKFISTKYACLYIDTSKNIVLIIIKLELKLSNLSYFTPYFLFKYLEIGI